ncbi:PilZ domain-containing protein [Thermomonas sp.]|uniref:PilZ domain-containing protein n=1 Tax=Thermomonas sp. TaxID=1971895 RepID=UPI003D1399F2
MTPEAADALLFGEALACREHVRAGFVPQVLEPQQAQALCLRAESGLAAIAVIEDSRADEEDATQGAALRRVEAKLDLLLALVGHLGRADESATEVSLQWSALGARLPATPDAAVGDTGLFRIQAANWLPEPLVLPARVVAIGPAPDAQGAEMTWLRFDPLTPGAASALERHLFRRHRQAVAERRRGP